jgi:hypothetical protein
VAKVGFLSQNKDSFLILSFTFCKDFAQQAHFIADKIYISMIVFT